MKLCFVVPLHGRFTLTSICLRQLRRTCDALRAEAIRRDGGRHRRHRGPGGIAFVMQTDDTAGTQRSDIYAFGFRATGAITRVAITPNTGPNFNAGSRLSIYGIG